MVPTIGDASDAATMQFEVRSTDGQVQARSARRLPFEPRGWQLAFRDQLRTALRNLPPRAGAALLATYATPDSAFADIENVLLYNIGTAIFNQLISGGVTCRREPSSDGWHHVRYEVTDRAPDPGGGPPAARSHINLNGELPQTAGGFWALLRPGLHRVGAPLPVQGRFTIDVTVSGPAAVPRLATMIKPLLDGWVAATHCHDGTNRDILLPRLGDPAAAAAQWTQLCDPTAAVLETRPLLRPFRNGYAWNPADERCNAFRIVPRPSPTWTITAELRPSHDDTT